MTDILYKIRNIRKTPAFQSLIAVNEHMGFPCDMDGIIYIPFFEKEANNYALSSEVFLEKKTRKIIGFHRFSEPVSVYTDKNELLTARKDVLSRGIIYTIDDIPCCIRQLYKKAEKELNYDRC